MLKIFNDNSKECEINFVSEQLIWPTRKKVSISGSLLVKIYDLYLILIKTLYLDSR